MAILILDESDQLIRHPELVEEIFNEVMKEEEDKVETYSKNTDR